MAKWADYLISAVKYNGDRTIIEGVRCCIDKGDSISESVDISRSKVIYLLDKGYTMAAIFKNIEGKWQKEANVRLVKVDGEKFIRTDKSQKRGDNMVNLPEF
ncbi:DUF3892 domain-containing protein [candidate division WOR-3 bacterium]|nr:DUF3892 domain-containing protein [candidate division WOR-3 bacterium]